MSNEPFVVILTPHEGSGQAGWPLADAKERGTLAGWIAGAHPHWLSADHKDELFAAIEARRTRADADQPIDVILNCPACGLQHIDAPSPGWENPPHRSHLCIGCGEIWRPADVPTNGVAGIKTRGKADTWAGEPADNHRSVAAAVKRMIDDKNRQIDALAERLAKAQALADEWLSFGAADRVMLLDAAAIGKRLAAILAQEPVQPEATAKRKTP